MGFDGQIGAVGDRFGKRDADGVSFSQVMGVSDRRLTSEEATVTIAVVEECEGV